MNTLIKNFCDLNARDVDSAGGKGANLGAMFSHGIPVPDGFVILTSCYDHFLRATGLAGRIAAKFHPLDGSDIDALTAVSARGDRVDRERNATRSHHPGDLFIF